MSTDKRSYTPIRLKIVEMKQENTLKQLRNLFTEDFIIFIFNLFTLPKKILR